MVVSGRYLTNQELFRLKCVCVGVAFMVMVLPQLVSELQAYTRGVGILKIDFRIKFDQQGISKNYVGFVKGYA